MPKRRKFDRTIPPCPGDPDKYVLVRGRYKYYWRKKPENVSLNASLRKSAGATHFTNQAAKDMMSLLSFYTQRMEMGQIVTRIGGRFKKAYLENDRVDFSCMKEFVFQEKYPTWKIFRGMIYKKLVRNTLELRIGVGFANVLAPTSSAESYQLHVILLYGQPGKTGGIRIETEESPIYHFKEKQELFWEPTVILPGKNKPWMVMLYIGCKMTMGVPTPGRYKVLEVVETGG